MHVNGRFMCAVVLAVAACANPEALPASEFAEEYAAGALGGARGARTSQKAIIEDLLDGNLAFAKNKRNGLPDIGPARRAELVAGQAPKAVILSCSDSRVPPEHVFRQGLGDVFVSRVAGNVPLEGEIASIEYAVEHLKVPVLMVLGHSSCGAVTAAVQQSRSGTELTPALTALVNEIMPAVTQAEANLPANGDLVDATIHVNARLAVTHLLARSAVLREAEEAGTLKVLVGIYELASGLVTLEAHHAGLFSEIH